MATQRPPADLSELEAAHVSLKADTAALRREHNRLLIEGGTKEEHRQHSRKLRAKIKELEHHIARLTNLRHAER